MADLASTVRIGSQTRLLGECRRAKEQLSTATTASVAMAPGADVQLSRAELEQLISEPLDRFLGALDETLRRNGIPKAKLAAVASRRRRRQHPADHRAAVGALSGTGPHRAATLVQRRHRRGGAR